MMTTSFQEFYNDQVKKQSTYGPRVELFNLSDLSAGLSRIRPLPAVTTNPQDAFLVTVGHKKMLERTPEEMEQYPDRGAMKSILCEDGMSGAPPGTDCLRCRLGVYVDANMKWARYIPKLLEQGFYRTLYFSGYIVPEENGASSGFEFPGEAGKEPIPYIFSTFSDPIIEKISYWLGRPQFKANATPCGPEERMTFAKLLDPHNGGVFEVTKVVTQTKNGKERKQLSIAMGHRVVPVPAKIMAALPSLDGFKKFAPVASVKAALRTVYPEELLREANIIA